MPHVLVTGGAGYIGSHTVIELIKSGFTPVILDNLCNSFEESVKRVCEITNQSVPLHKINLTDSEGIDELFKQYNFHHVVHFAGLKALTESVEKPLEYYRNNVTGTVCLLEVMKKHGVFNLVFSSSATVYGFPQYLPVDEKHPVGGCTNPYGRTKYFIEEILKDLCKSDERWNVALLRYFNPIGAHKSGLIGEDPQDIPNNLLPFIAQVAGKRRPLLTVFGGDYDTPDGTGVRDFIHVVDLARAHVSAIEKMKTTPDLGCKTYNIGTGKGYSVLEMIEAFKKASGRDIPYKVGPRRPMDVASCYSKPDLAEKELGWKAEMEINEMCEDSWRWQSMNPLGFRSHENNEKVLNKCVENKLPNSTNHNGISL